MKAIRVREFGEPDVMKLEDVPDPTAGPGQVVVRLYAAGVNPVETYIRSGKYAVKPNLPYTPGSDGAGEVESAGAGVTHLKPGDRVYTQGSVSGTYAKKALCDAKNVHPLPPNVSFVQGAAVGVPYVTAWFGIWVRAQAKAGEVVLVHGASGGVGTAAVQLARAAGMTVFGTAGTDKGRQLVLDNGAHQAFDHHAPDALQKVKDATPGGRGVDVILEMAAHTNLAKDPAALAPRGRVIVIGSRGPIEINPRDYMSRNADVRAMTIMSATDAELTAAHAAILAGLENGTLQPVVGKELPLAEAPRAHKEVLDAGAHGKIVLTM